MKDVILLIVGFVSGALVAEAFGVKVKAFIASLLNKSAAKIEGK